MKLKESFETEVYVSDDGFVGIKQRDPFDTEPSVIILTPEQATLVAKELNRLVRTTAEWRTPEEEHQPA